MALFEKKQYLTRGELREILRKTPAPKINRDQRIKMEQDIFGRKKYGEYLNKEEYQRALRKLSEEKYRAKSGAERLDLERKIKFLKGLGGV